MITILKCVISKDISVNSVPCCHSVIKYSLENSRISSEKRWTARPDNNDWFCLYFLWIPIRTKQLVFVMNLCVYILWYCNRRSCWDVFVYFVYFVYVMSPPPPPSVVVVSTVFSIVTLTETLWICARISTSLLIQLRLLLFQQYSFDYFLIWKNWLTANSWIFCVFMICPRKLS